MDDIINFNLVGCGFLKFDWCDMLDSYVKFSSQHLALENDC